MKAQFSLPPNANAIVEFNKNLSEVSYYKIGGPADIYIPVTSESKLDIVFEALTREKIPYKIFGSGTNVLFDDMGFRGAVVHILPEDQAAINCLADSSSEVLLEVSANISKSALLLRTLNMGLEGLEFSAGIPGTMGGAICMNAGTKWGSYSDVVEEVTFFSSKNGYFNKKANELSFKYRGLGTRILDEETIVQKVTMRLKKSNGLDKSRALVDEILTYRGRRQPLEYPNCGSVFKNPPAPQRGAGRLIEACGLKGLTVGEAQISNKHANFILNLGNAKSSDVKELIEKAREQVLRKFSVNLEPEVKLL